MKSHQVEEICGLAWRAPGKLLFPWASSLGAHSSRRYSNPEGSSLPTLGLERLVPDSGRLSPRAANCLQGTLPPNKTQQGKEYFSEGHADGRYDVDGPRRRFPHHRVIIWTQGFKHLFHCLLCLTLANLSGISRVFPQKWAVCAKGGWSCWTNSFRIWNLVDLSSFIHVPKSLRTQGLVQKSPSLRRLPPLVTRS